MSMSKMVILLTACINPNGMPFTKLTMPTERMKQYIYALRFYLNNTSIPVVFVENSNTDISIFFKKEIRPHYLEIHTFQGNKNLEKGKGYGEAEIIEYAINHSKLICSNCCLIKITGRLVIKNLNSLINIRRILFLNQSIQSTINSELSFADSRIIIAPIGFYNLFLRNKNRINDSNKVFFEHILAETIKIQSKFDYIPFVIEPQISGYSGSTGEKYEFNAQTFNQMMTYLNYSLYLYTKLKKESKSKKYHLKDSLFFIFHNFIKSYCKLCNSKHYI